MGTHQLEVSKGRSIAYQTSPGERRPTVVMVPGLHSYTHMNGNKAACLQRYCDMNDLPCVAYDHECYGESDGDVKDVTFSRWVEDAVSVIDRHKATLPPVVAARLESGDIHVHTHEYGDALLKEDFAVDSRKYEIDLEKKLDITCPVRIIHGLADTEVDPLQSLQLCKSIVSDDIDLIYRKNSEHQLESPPDLELFLVTLDRMIKDNPVR